MVMSAYMLLTVTFLHLYKCSHGAETTPWLYMASLLAYGIGLFFFGPVCNWLIQRYRRGKVCSRAMAIQAVCAAATYFIMVGHMPAHPYLVIALRFVTGAFYGLAVMVLYGSLVIDKSESWLRTKANHSAAWLARLAMAIGPLLAIVLYRNAGLPYVCMAACAMTVVATMLVRVVNMPFKAPEEDVRLFSLDRFIRPQSWRLWLFTMGVFACYGLLVSHAMSVAFYAMVLLGFVWALASEHWAVACGYSRCDLLVSVAFVLMGLGAIHAANVSWSSCLMAGMLGAGLGMTGSKAQLLFLDHCQHCQRGTAVSSFFLACEAGVVIGTLLGLVGG